MSQGKIPPVVLHLGFVACAVGMGAAQPSSRVYSWPQEFYASEPGLSAAPTSCPVAEQTQKGYLKTFEDFLYVAEAENGGSAECGPSGLSDELEGVPPQAKQSHAR